MHLAWQIQQKALHLHTGTLSHKQEELLPRGQNVLPLYPAGATTLPYQEGVQAQHMISWKDLLACSYSRFWNNPNRVTPSQVLHKTKCLLGHDTGEHLVSSMHTSRWMFSMKLLAFHLNIDSYNVSVMASVI